MVPAKWPFKGHGLPGAAADSQPHGPDYTSAKAQQCQQRKAQPIHPGG